MSRSLSNRRRWREERRQRIADGFANHRADLRVVGEGDDRIELLTWGQPGTVNRRIHYTARGPWLFVTGDLYDAVYERAAGLAWWAGCDLDYFAEKCKASPYGRGYREWEESAARASVAYHLWHNAGKEERRVFFDERGHHALGTEEEWRDWLSHHGDDVWGDAWEYGDVGLVVSWECEAHLTGLKLALAQLATTEAEARAA